MKSAAYGGEEGGLAGRRGSGSAGAGSCRPSQGAQDFERDPKHWFVFVFVFWLHQVLVVARGIFRCGMGSSLGCVGSSLILVRGLQSA